MSLQGHENLAAQEPIRTHNRISSNSKRAIVVIGIFATVTGMKIMALLKELTFPCQPIIAAVEKKEQDMDDAKHKKLCGPFDIPKDECVTTEPCSLSFLDDGLVLQVNGKVCYIQTVTIRNVVDITLPQEQVKANMPEGITGVEPLCGGWALTSEKSTLLFASPDFQKTANTLRRESGSSVIVSMPYIVNLDESSSFSYFVRPQGTCDIQFTVKKAASPEPIDTQLAAAVK